MEVTNWGSNRFSFQTQRKIHLSDMWKNVEHEGKLGWSWKDAHRDRFIRLRGVSCLSKSVQRETIYGWTQKACSRQVKSVILIKTRAARHWNVQLYFSHQCPHCPHISTCKGAYNKHFKSVHLKLRDFICTDCGLGFSTNSQLVKILAMKILNSD